CTGALTKSYRKIGKYVIGRFRRWLKRKHKWNTLRYNWLNDQGMYVEYHLVDILSLQPRYS
ncbi:MAG: hypothetical protein LBW85_02365, partial [Deltaproteobacteria bacterium]|nr:hypothetical protein [Deltaproteobacteria bacterium]